MNPLRIAMVGLDTSHVVAFAKIFHDTSNPYHVPGVRVVAAYPGGSPDFDLSINRVEGFTNDLRDNHGVKIVDSIAQLKGESDVIFLESVDGRVHLEQFREIAEWGLPVFIDKPLSASSADARAIAELAARHNVRVLTSSAVRFGESLQNALKDEEGGAITGGDFYGPMALVDKLPGYYWYGIHAAEMLYATLGAGCREVQAFRQGDYDVIIGKWADGRIGTIRGNRTGNNGFGGIVHREKKSREVILAADAKPFYAGLLEAVLRFINGEVVIALDESVELMRFLEAANESVACGGKSVAL